MKDLDLLRYFLSIEVAYSSLGYLLLQHKYISNILECATLRDPSLADFSFASTLIELNLKLLKDDDDPLQQPAR